MKRNEWIAVVVVIIIVAVIASLVTSNITGNVINLNQDRSGKYQVYTQSEIDNKINGLQANIQAVDNSVCGKYALISETKTVNNVTSGGISIVVDNSRYLVELTYVDSTSVILSIYGGANEIDTPKLTEGTSFMVDGIITVKVKDIAYSSKDSGISKAGIVIDGC
jgi:hypothetical protein